MCDMGEADHKGYTPEIAVLGTNTGEPIAGIQDAHAYSRWMARILSRLTSWLGYVC